MHKAFLAVLLLGTGVANAADLGGTIEAVRRSCGGISAELSDMKRMAGINTAVTGVGTVAGGVAVGTGIAKAGTDKELAKWEQILDEMIKKEKDGNYEFTTIDMPTYEEWMAKLGNDAGKDQVSDKIDELESRSKTLGNVRTGTLAANTVTNIVSTAIASNNRIKGDLQSQINDCIEDVEKLSLAMGQARISGDASGSEISRAEKIVSECGMWSTVDLSSVNKRAGGAATSSGVGAVIGAAGTVTSAMANSPSVRKGDDKKEKNLNTASNVLAGGATVASLSATIFNASQISAIKRAATVADNCEEALR